MIAALSSELAQVRPLLRPSPASPGPPGVRRLAPAPAARPRRPAAGDADRCQLGLRAGDADRPRVRRALRRRPRVGHPRPRARDRRPRLHEPLRERRRAGGRPHGAGGQSAGDDRRRPRRRAADPGRHVRLRDRHADAAVRVGCPRGALDAAPHPRPGGVLLAPCPASPRSRRPRTRSSASGGTSPLARPAASPSRRSARAQSRSRRSATCSPRPGSSTVSLPPTCAHRSSTRTTACTRSSSACARSKR